MWQARRLTRIIILGALAMRVMCGLSDAEETESQALARRLAELEAQVAWLSQSPLPSHPPEQGWSSPGVVGASTEQPTGWVTPPPAPNASKPPEKPKYPTVLVNGFFQADMLYFSQDPKSEAINGDIQDGAGFRRFRLSARGAVAENVNYFAQLDFGVIGRPSFTDVWGEITKVPVFGNVRFGQWKQPFSLEVVSSVRYQTFMERSLLFQTFDAFRHIGIGFYDHSDDEHLTWAMSVFRQGQDQYGNDIGDAGGVASAGRITWLPYFEKAGDSLSYLHLGSAYFLGDPATNTIRFATIPEMFLGSFVVESGSTVGTSLSGVPLVYDGTPPFVNTGPIRTHMFANIGTELLWVEGPWSVQSEVQMSSVNQRGGPQLTFWGFYAFGSLFLTGESRPYDRKIGALDRVVPLRPFLCEPGCERGTGAWEVALRCSYIDLNNDNIQGGRLTDITAGLNWYLNGYTKIQFNYVHAMQQKAALPHSTTDIYGVRAQVDW